MKYQSTLKRLIPIICVLALLAPGAGLINQTPVEPYPYTNHRGEETMIYGQGLYN